MEGDPEAGSLDRRGRPGYASGSPQRQVSGLHWMLTLRPGRRAEKQPDDDDDDENLTVSVSVAQLF